MIGINTATFTRAGTVKDSAVGRHVLCLLFSYLMTQVVMEAIMISNTLGNIPLAIAGLNI